MNFTKSILVILLTQFFCVLLIANPLEQLPVQDAGRIKPFDTFARESLTLVHGRSVYKDKKTGRKLNANEAVFSWLIVPEAWKNTEFVQVRHSGLREAMQLDKKRIYYSPAELMFNERLPVLIQDLRSQQEAETKLNPFYQAVQTLETQISLFNAMGAGLAPRILPNTDRESSSWLHVSKLPQEFAEPFANIIKGFSAYAKTEGKNDTELSQAVSGYIEKAKSVYGANYAPFSVISAEIHYNKFHPFMYSWIFYLLAALLFALVTFGGREKFLIPAWVCLGVAFLLHTYGFGLRVYISGRAPVSNMYETVVWVAWGSVLLAALLDKIYKLKVLLFSACIVATFSLILCDLSSHVLDGAIHPLEPVLRDNFWLIVHVLSITLSYAAFFVAFVIGDIVLFQAFINEEKYKKSIRTSVNAIYRMLQVGVALLAAGTILGGVWADYSWGRFWGWDPKETWAFIALLGYLAILHGRLVGWLKDYGMAAASILAFSLVIMAWYGVNFVLGAGLHTYGFGAGGVEYVSAFVAAHVLYVAFVTTVRHVRQGSK